MSLANTNELNLTDDFFPVCLMKFKNALNLMRPGDCMDVLVADREIADALEDIICQNDDTKVIRNKRRYHYRLRFIKNDKNKNASTTPSKNLNHSIEDVQ